MNTSVDQQAQRVSVLVPCYNASQWLQDAVDSVLNQTFRDFELILVDDGSSDATPAILEASRQRDPRVVVVTKAHTGLADSLNAGLAVAGGRWIARLDADDLCEPCRLEQQLAFAERNAVVLAGSGFVELDESGNRIKAHRYPHQHHRLVRHLERSKRFFPHSSALFARAAAEAVGGYNVRFEKSQDRDLWLRLAETGRIACMPELLVHVRRHGGSISANEEGHGQLIYGTLASSCYLLRIAEAPDPSAAADEETWREFLAWASRHPETAASQARRRRWQEARAAYFGKGGGVSGFLAFIASLLASGAAMRLVAEKLLGSSLPARLARDWRSRSCAGS